MNYYKTIAESNNFIVLDTYNKHSEVNEPPAVYQTEAALEKEFIQDLINQGYEYASNLTTIETMLANVKVQLQRSGLLKLCFIGKISEIIFLSLLNKSFTYSLDEVDYFCD